MSYDVDGDGRDEVEQNRIGTRAASGSGSGTSGDDDGSGDGRSRTGTETRYDDGEIRSGTGIGGPSTVTASGTAAISSNNDDNNNNLERTHSHSHSHSHSQTQTQIHSQTHGHTDMHVHTQSRRRFFIGSMPDETPGVEDGDDEREAAAEFVREHGLRIFLRQGGRLDEWTEAKAKEYKERLKRRIVENVGWYGEDGKERGGRRRKKKKGRMGGVEWSGETFEVGMVAGVSVNMLSTPMGEMEDGGQEEYLGDGQGEMRSSASVVHWDNPTAASGETTPVEYSNRPDTLLSAPAAQGGRTSSEEGTNHDESTSSKTHLFANVASSPASLQHRGSKNNDAMSARARSGIKSILNRPGKDKDKNVSVRYAETPGRFDATLGGFDEPASPSDVLQRRPSQMEASSAAAAAEAIQSTTREMETSASADTDIDAVMRDRMLVRVFRCEHENIKYPFGEKECRVMRGLENKEWDEFLVVWKNQRIELYENYWTPCKERILGHKHLAFVIPLLAPTRISVFSAVDLSFCLICRPTPVKDKKTRSHRSIFHRSSRGLNVFILRPKSRSRSVDWIWKIWEKLGGTLPTSIEVNCPLVHARVSIPIQETGAGWKDVTRDYVIRQCTNVLENSFAWKTVIELPITRGKRLELCWKMDTKLDWVWLRDDVDGVRRDWEVLFGLVIQKLGCPTQLQLHLASHYPTQITTKDHKHLEEPPSVEGYAYFHKRKTQGRKQYYLSTHDYYLCAVAVNKVVHPPTPTDLRRFTRDEREFLEEENGRLRDQVVDAQRVWDLRQVVVVRRAGSVIVQNYDEGVVRRAEEERMGGGNGTGTGTGSGEAGEGPPDLESEDVTQLLEGEGEMERTESDIEDEGGDVGLAKAKNKGRLRMYRSFELVLKNGRILRFEVRRTKNAVEWVMHLRALVDYWKKRVKDDTLNQMNILRETGKGITSSKRYFKDGQVIPQARTDPENATMYLDEFWNWCVVEGCRQILRSGKLYVKNKSRGQYRHTYNILVRGYLISYKAGRSGNLHHQQIGCMNLIDAYVCSGYYAALALMDGEYDPNAAEVVKRLEDGLETRDVEEDTIFLVWFRGHGVHGTHGSNGPGRRGGGNNNINDNKSVRDGAGAGMESTPVLPMSAKHQMRIFRARNRLERDAWCWALNCEIERLGRETKGREERLRV